jgi:hypothetical protein
LAAAFENNVQQQTSFALENSMLLVTQTTDETAANTKELPTWGDWESNVATSAASRNFPMTRTTNLHLKHGLHHFWDTFYRVKNLI